jgi:hypothetical protein
MKIMSLQGATQAIAMGQRGNLVAHANRIGVYYEIAALAIDMFY